jgi:hypothetical protein
MEPLCSLCGSDEHCKEGLNEENKPILLCENCRCCEDCNDEIEDIDTSNWIVVERVIRPGGWIFQDPSTFERFTEYALFCGVCRDKRKKEKKKRRTTSK